MPDTAPKSRELLHRWRQGEPAALDALIERNRDFLRGYVGARVGARLRARAEIDDFVQEALLRAVAFAPGIEPCDTVQVQALLARIAENVLRDQHDHHAAQRRNAERETLMSPSELDRPAWTATTPARHAGRREDHTWVRLAVELLEAEDRVVVMRHQWQGETFKSIGERLGIGESGARMRFQRALPKLLRKVQMLRSGKIDDALRA